MPYTSRITYEPKRIHAAAVYCSDGRVGEHCDDFLMNGLKLPRYDRVALPGGPACLAGHTEAHLEEQGVIDELKFLVEAHALKRIVLIQHEGCAFYAHRLGLPADLLAARQRMDLLKADHFIRRVIGLDRIDCYYARIDGEAITFDPVKLK
ncbi:MAG: carbonic anhydrase [Phycisphaerales bacterium]